MNKRWLLAALIIAMLAVMAPAPAQFTLPSAPRPIDSLPPSTHAAGRSAAVAPVADSCHIAVTDFYFGTYTAGQSNTMESSFGMTVLCETPQIVQLSVSPSANSQSFVTRSMRNTQNGDELRYQLYVDWGRTRVWGDGTNLSVPIILDTAESDTATAFGSVGGEQNVSAGNYQDEIVITLDIL